MKGIIKIIMLLIVMVIGSNVFAQNEVVVKLSNGWKFVQGDNLEYAKPDYNDAGWKAIQTDKIWEAQGYDPYDGYAWYRIKIVIPSSLKNNAYLKDSLKIFLGKINNFDQTFLNGKFIGSNGKKAGADAIADNSFINAPQSLWDYARRYTISADDAAILWDKENVISVRVYDEGGQGGIYTGNQTIGMAKISEYLTIDIAQIPFQYKKVLCQKHSA